ncbi:MAG: hypothetical protein ACK5XX_02480 [Holosporales bacterium]|jgi:hypothetical protein
MKLSKIIVIALICCSFKSPAAAQSVNVKSYLDKEMLSQFVVDNFDILTIRSSFGSRRISGQPNYFKSFGLTPTTINKQEIIFDEKDWFYGVKILGVKDYNDDGIEDIAVCFTDRAKEGSYYTVTPLILTRYSESMPLIALAHAPYYAECLRKGGDN